MKSGAFCSCEIPFTGMNKRCKACHPTPNRGAFRRFFNKVVVCPCCGKRTQSQIGSGTDLCRGCYDFGGEYNTFQDGGSFTNLPRPTHDCARCKTEYAEAEAEFQQENSSEPNACGTKQANKKGIVKMKRSKKTATKVAAEEPVTEVTETPTAPVAPKGKKSAKKAAKPTAATLQEAVVETEAKIESNGKKPAKKAAKKSTLGDIFGYSIAAVARALGKAEWMPADAIAAINSMVPKASPAAIRTYVQAGKAGVRGEPAPLTKTQLGELKALVVVEA